MSPVDWFRPSRAAIVALTLAAACGGGERASTDSAVAEAPAALQGTETVEGEASAPLPNPGEGAVPGAPAPITGSLIEVQLIGDERGYRFEPAQITAKAGDGVKFVVVSGGPHEIAFDLDAVPEAARQQLQVNMPNASEGRSPLLVAPLEAYTVSLGALIPGSYPFVSTPRLPQGMKGTIRIE